LTKSWPEKPNPPKPAGALSRAKHILASFLKERGDTIRRHPSNRIGR